MAQGRPKGALPGLAQREQQILDLLYRISPATAAEVEAALDHRLSNATVRTILRNLETKGYVQHVAERNTFVYSPTEDGRSAARNAFNRIVETFFDGSTPSAVATLIDDRAADLSEATLDDLAELIDQHRRARRGEGR